MFAIGRWGVSIFSCHCWIAYWRIICRYFILLKFFQHGPFTVHWEFFLFCFLQKTFELLVRALWRSEPLSTYFFNSKMAKLWVLVRAKQHKLNHFYIMTGVLLDLASTVFPHNIFFSFLFFLSSPVFPWDVVGTDAHSCWLRVLMDNVALLKWFQ